MPTYDEIEYSHGINKTYVELLCEYLRKRYELRQFNGWLLDVGAGTGDYYQTFALKSHIHAVPTGDYDLEGDWNAYDNQYSYIFCKSVLEHIKNTQHFLSETKRVLKSGGLVIFLVPDYLSQWKNFYDDSTHVKSFTKKSITQAFLLAGFQDVKCELFYQLPFVWRYPFLKFIPFLVRTFIPDCFKYHKGRQNVLIRHSKERMLLLTARKSMI